MGSKKYRTAYHIQIIDLFPLFTPYTASPFSAITGLYIVSSSMHPLNGYDLSDDKRTFFNNKGNDTAFLDHHKIGVIYGACSNTNLTHIHNNVYLYPRLHK